MSVPDRIATLQAQNVVTGIDFIFVNTDQQQLDVYFLTLPGVASTLLAGITGKDINIYSNQASLPVIEIDHVVGWNVVNNQDVLTIVTKQPGDFSLYRFKIDDT